MLGMPAIYINLCDDITVECHCDVTKNCCCSCHMLIYLYYLLQLFLLQFYDVEINYYLILMLMLIYITIYYTTINTIHTQYIMSYYCSESFATRHCYFDNSTVG